MDALILLTATACAMALMTHVRVRAAAREADLVARKRVTMRRDLAAFLARERAWRG